MVVRWLMSPGGGDLEQLDYRFLVAVDIEGFSKHHARAQMEIQRDLDRALNEAASAAGLNRETWERQVGGDGELAVLPTDTDGLRLVALFPRELTRALRKVNQERSTEPRIRVRVAIHHGTLAQGSFGPVGLAPIVISRLLDAEVLRQALTQRAGEDLVLIVSASLYTDIIETRFAGLDPAEFYPVEVHAKDVVYPSYIYGRRPGQPRPGGPT